MKHPKIKLYMKHPKIKLYDPLNVHVATFFGPGAEKSARIASKAMWKAGYTLFWSIRVGDGQRKDLPHY